MQMDTQSATSENSKQQIQEDIQKQFEVKHVIGRGTFGTAQWLNKNENVAIKSIIKDPKYKNREVSILSQLQHESIIRLHLHYESYDEKTKKKYTNLVMQYLPCTLLSIIKSNHSKHTRINIDTIISYAQKMLQGLAYLEQKNVTHRDLKPSNILIDEKQGKVKICDFGSAKIIKQGDKSITYICSRYYRAPELILGCTQYSSKIDIWSVACVIAQVITTLPLFDGSNNLDQIAKIFKVLGTPTAEDLLAMKVDAFDGEVMKVVPIGLSEKISKGNNNCSPLLIDLLEKLLLYNPEKRLSPKQALNHPVFTKQKQK